jgi:hypothetical protein
MDPLSRLRPSLPQPAALPVNRIIGGLSSNDGKRVDRRVGGSKV